MVYKNYQLRNRLADLTLTELDGKTAFIGTREQWNKVEFADFLMEDELSFVQ